MKNNEVENLIKWIFDSGFERTFDGKQYYISTKGVSQVKYYTLDQLIKLYKVEN